MIEEVGKALTRAVGVLNACPGAQEENEGMKLVPNSHSAPAELGIQKVQDYECANGNSVAASACEGGNSSTSPRTANKSAALVSFGMIVDHR